MTLPRAAKIIFHHSIVTWWNKVWHFCQVLCVNCNPRKTSKSFRNQNTLVLLCLRERKKKKHSLKIKHPKSCCNKIHLKSSTPVLLGLQKTLGIKHLVLLDMQEMMYDVLFSVLDVTATKKKPSKNFRNQNTLVLLGLQKKKTPWKSSTQSSVVKNHSKSSIPNLLGLQKTVENQATYFWWNMQGDTLEPSTYFCWNCKQDFEIKNLLLFGMQKKKKKRKTLEDQAKHLLLLGMQKNTWKPSTYFLLGMQKQHHTLKIQHLLLLLGMQKKKKSWKSSTYFFCWVCQKHLKSTTTSGNWVTYSCNNYPNKQTNNHSTLIENKSLFPSAAPYIRFVLSKLSLL